jgi:hypothetical protein
VLKATSEKIGAVFDDVVKGVDITPDKATLDASAKALETYRLLAPKAAASPLISSVHQALVGSFRSGKPHCSINPEIMANQSFQADHKRG